MPEFALPRSIHNLSSGFIGTLGCWASGIGLTTAAVAFSVAGGLSTHLLGLTAVFTGAIFCGVARSAPAEWKLRLTAVCLSLCLALLLAEVVLRIVTHFPINTSSNMIPHPQLGYVLAPDLADVDSNGFRNIETVTQADIVAIGDSHTQGMNAEAAQAWPQVLSRQLNRSVYNMGVGGYGPLQYDVLVSEALALQPKQIVVGLYLGNDFGDVARGIQQRHSEREIDNSFRHALKYHTATGSAIHVLISRSRIGRPAGFEISHTSNPTFVSHQRVTGVSRNMDCSDPQIANAVQQTLQILSHAQQRCTTAGIGLTVLLIPTRESAYFHSEHSAPESWPNPLRQLVQRETDLRNRVLSGLQQQQIHQVDLLPLLTAGVDSDTRVYAAFDEGHPVAAGYELYAAAVVGSLKQ